MAKRIYLIFILTISFIASLSAQFVDKQCYYGISFEISKNPNWGFGELVITDVEANSPAEEAGIKIGDIIMEINGKATYLRDNVTIANWLFDNPWPEVTFTIRNMGAYFKEYPLVRRCLNVNSISEQQLSSLFSLYSLENTNSQKFTIPLQVKPTENVNYTDYHTFDFYTEENVLSPAIESGVTSLIEKELMAKGLVRDTNDPDIIIQTYYSAYPNARFTGLDNVEGEKKQVARFDSDRQKMVTLPIFDMHTSRIDVKGQYVIEYGFSFYERKYVNPGQMTQIWDCSIKDFLSEKMTLEEYARIHTPLMLMQFPYSESKTESSYEVRFNKYNYTGIYFNADDLTTVQDVVPNSPAFRVGIRAGHVIKKIDNTVFTHTKATLTKGYKLFVNDALKYRNVSTRFTNSEGYEDCMYWNKPYYADIAKLFSKKIYMTHFAYLYDFEPYVNPKYTGNMTVETWDGKQNRLFTISPEVKSSVIIRIIDK